jgi:hypothetical protein
VVVVVDVVSLDVLSVDVVSLDVLSVDVVSLDVLSVDVVSVEPVSTKVSEETVPPPQADRARNRNGMGRRERFMGQLLWGA